jgi:heme oxygenase
MTPKTKRILAAVGAAVAAMAANVVFAQLLTMELSAGIHLIRASFLRSLGVTGGAFTALSTSKVERQQQTGFTFFSWLCKNIAAHQAESRLSGDAIGLLGL